MTSKTYLKSLANGAAWLLLSCSSLAEMPPEISALQSQWDRVNFEMQGNTQVSSMEALVAECDGLLDRMPTVAEALIWCGIVNSSHAGLAGSLSAMKYAKKARGQLQQAIEINGDTLSGAAYTSLGTLYFKVPGWPIGFGDDDKASELLQRGIEANPDGIDSNYFYADYLCEEKQWTQAIDYLDKAAAAAPRAGREIADAGRQKEIVELRTIAEKKLSH